MVPVLHGHTVVHECRGLKCSPAETGERKLVLERLPEDHSSRMAYEVRVDHPEWCQSSDGPRTRQSPEVVCRTNDEAHAKYVYGSYAKLLGGEAPASFTPSAAAPREESKRLASMERELDELRAVVLELQGGGKKK